jgi:hypothetical protein
MLTAPGGLRSPSATLLKARTTKGRGRAKARGVRMGRRPKLTPHQQTEPQERLYRSSGNDVAVGGLIAVRCGVILMSTEERAVHEYRNFS